MSHYKEKQLRKYEAVKIKSDGKNRIELLKEKK